MWPPPPSFAPAVRTRRRILVTSRYRGLDQFGPVFRVGVLDAQAAEDYLVERAARPNERADAARVAEALGYLPLALSHAGSYCSAGISFSDYLDLLEGLPAAEVFDSNPEAFYEQTVASTWETSMREAEAGAPLARPVLQMAAYLAPETIPLSLFDVVLGQPAPGAQAVSRCVGCPAPPLPRRSIRRPQRAPPSPSFRGNGTA